MGKKSKNLPMFFPTWVRTHEFYPQYKWIVKEMNVSAAQKMEQKSAERVTVEGAAVPKGYKRTELGVIPEDWEVKTFGTVAYVRNQKVDPKRIAKQLFCVELEHISQVSGQLLGSTETTSSSSLKCEFYEQDVLFGKLRAYLRKYWLADKKGVASTEIWPIVAIKDMALPGYIYQIVQTDDFIEEASISYGTHMPRSDWKIIRNYNLAVPPLPEQQAIAKALSDVDDWVASLDVLLAKKRDLKTATMQQLLTGHTRLPGFSGEWETKIFGELFDFLPTANNSRADLSEDGEVKYIHYGDIHTQWNHFVDFSKATVPAIHSAKIGNAAFLKDGDLIVADASEDYEGVGKSIEVKNIGNLKAIAGLHTFLLRPKNGYLATGFTGYIQSMLVVKTAINRIATGLKVYGISKNNLKEVIVPLPKPEEQNAIATILSDMDAEIATIEAERDKASAIKQGMMQELLTGKTRLV